VRATLTSPFHRDVAQGDLQDDKKVDVYISCFIPDLAVAMKLADILLDRGYTVAPRVVVGRADKKLDRRLTPSDARCVIAAWSPHAIDDLQIQGDARTAGLQGRLIEVGLRKARPAQRFSDAALIVFPNLDILAHSEPVRAILQRVEELCGAPRRKPSDFMRRVPALAATAAAVAGAVVVGAMWNQNAEEKRAIAEHTFAPPASQEVEPTLLASAKRPSLTPTADLALERGGPKDYISEDLGTAPTAPAPVVAAPPPAAPVDTAPEGPER